MNTHIVFVDTQNIDVRIGLDRDVFRGFEHHSRGSRSVEGDGRSVERPGEMGRSGIAADREIGISDGVTKLSE